MKQKGNWDDKRPGVGERLSSRLSVHGNGTESLGGMPELTTVDYAAAIGMVYDNLQRIVLGAKYGDWPTEKAKLEEIVIRHSWTTWAEKKKKGNIDVELNARLANVALREWYLPGLRREQIGDTARAKKLGVDFRRFKTSLKTHHRDLVAWLDAIDAEAVRVVRKILRRHTHVKS